MNLVEKLIENRRIYEFADAKADKAKTVNAKTILTKAGIKFGGIAVLFDGASIIKVLSSAKTKEAFSDYDEKVYEALKNAHLLDGENTCVCFPQTPDGITAFKNNTVKSADVDSWKF